MQDTAARRYSKGSMIFHWVTAVLVIMNWQIAEQAEKLSGPLRGEVMGYHKAWGITILALTVARLAWRLTHRTPPYPANYPGWVKALARTVHTLFYVLLIGLPLGGWLAQSLAGKPIDFFGLFTIPRLPVGENGELAGTIFDVHATGGTILLGLIVLHVAGALKHTLIQRDGELWRMLPFGTPPRPGRSSK